MSPRSQILDWAERGHLAPEHLNAALQSAGVTPDLARWRQLLSQLMLATGTLLLGAGIIFFFAYNWQGLPPLVRFGIVEATLLAAFAIAWTKGLASHAGRAALFFAALITGALLALIGQTYQMGADPWQLFALWAGLILPWAFAARMPDLWLLGQLLLNVALAVYPWESGGTLEKLGLLNLVAQVLWEVLAPHPRLAPRLAGAATAAAFSAAALGQIFDRPQTIYGLLYTLWLVATLIVFIRFRRDLFLVAASLGSGIAAITSICTRGIFRSSEPLGAVLAIAVLVIVLSGAAAKWLQYLHKEDAV